MRRGPHLMETVRSNVRKASSKQGHRLARFRDSPMVNGQSYAACLNPGCHGVAWAFDDKTYRLIDSDCSMPRSGLT